MNAAMFETELKEHIIPFWNQLKDDEFGGFYGAVSHDLQIEKQSDKGVILNSRIMWFYSKAYMRLKEKKLLEMAENAYQFFKRYCYDYEQGGIFWSVTYDGKISDDTKHTYNLAFAIYALSAYYEASRDKEALDTAYELYHKIEEKCRDEEGYLEAFGRAFQAASNDKLSENGVIAGRTMNTLLHVMEAYTELYRVDSSRQVGESVRWILRLFDEKIYDRKNRFCTVFMDDDYHTLLDLESFGHDIETAWLIDRTCEVLNDDEYTKRMSVITNELAEQACKGGYDTKQKALNSEREKEKTDTQKIWWVQAEAVIGFYNAYQKQPEKAEYLQAAEEVWDFIVTYMIDKRSGEWFESVKEDYSVDSEQGLAHAWKCPYHNGRMCLEMMKRLSN